MRAFTREVESALEWFTLTHQLHGGYGWALWQRTALPAVGGVGDQPAKVMEALALIAREENALIGRATRKGRTGGQDTNRGTPRRRRRG